MSKGRVLFGLLGSLFILGISEARAASSPVIGATVTNFAVSPATLTISGTNFGTVMPTVTLAGVALTVTAFSNSSVTAQLPSTAVPGSFALVLTNNSSHTSGRFTPTIGAAGPQGPAGPAGPAVH